MRNELEKEIKRLVKNIKRRVSRVIKKYGSTPGTDRVAKSKSLNYKVKGLNEKELRDKLRELKYIDSLKTTFMEGVKQYNQNFKGIKQFLDDNPDYKDKFWELYNKLIEEKRIQNYYKYDVMDIIAESISYGVDDYEAVADTIDNILANESNNSDEYEDDDDEGEIW